LFAENITQKEIARRLKMDKSYLSAKINQSIELMQARSRVIRSADCRMILEKGENMTNETIEQNQTTCDKCDVRREKRRTSQRNYMRKYYDRNREAWRKYNAAKMREYRSRSK
jgi:transcriptional regulator with XRE-family HTH domain